MKVVDLANQIFLDELGEPADLTVAAITEWIRGKVGELNVKLHTTYSLNSSLELEDDYSNELTEEAGSVLKCMYMVGFYQRKHRSALTAMDADVIVSFTTEDGGGFRKLNRNEIAKGLLDAKKEAVKDLDMAVAHYQSHTSSPRQVTGDDLVRNNSEYTVSN